MAGTIGLKAVFTADDKVSGAVRSMTASIKSLSAAGDSLGKLDSFNSKIFDKLKMGAVAGATALGFLGFELGKNAVEAGSDFEQSITNVGSVMGKTRGQISELEQQALSLGVSTQFSASEVSEAMEHMARKGFDAEEILGGIPGVLDAVAASGEGMAEVSDAVGSSIRSFGLQAKDATHVADVLTFASEKTGASILNLGSALAIVGPTARTLGVSIEDATAAVGLLQKMGLDASTSASATATMLAKISKPSKDAGQSMSAMGIKFKNAHGDMLPFRDVLGQFVKAGDKVGGNMDRMAFFAELVGLRGDKAALALSDLAKAGDFDKLQAGLSNVDGKAHRVAEIKLDTTRNQWKLLGSTVEVLEDKLWNLNSGPLKGTIQRINAWVSANQDLIISGAQEYVGKIVTKVTELSTKIDVGISALSGFKDGLKEAFKDSKTIKAFGWVLSTVFGGSDDSKTPAEKAFALGKTVGDLTFAFLGFGSAVKIVKGTVFAFEIGMKAVRGVMIAYEAVQGFVTGTIALYTTATGVGTASTVAMGEAMTAASIGGGELALSEEAAAVAAAELEAASIGAEAGIAGVGVAAGVALAPIVAATAALAALAAAGYEAYKLMGENGGASGTWAGVKGFFGVGTKDWGAAGTKEGLDSVMDQQARARYQGAPAAPFSAKGAVDDLTGGNPGGGYAGAFGVGAGAAPTPGPFAGGYVTPGMAPPPAPPPMIAQAPAITPEALHAAVSQALEVTVKADAGTTAEVTKKPKGAKVNLTASGAP